MLGLKIFLSRIIVFELIEADKSRLGSCLALPCSLYIHLQVDHPRNTPSFSYTRTSKPCFFAAWLPKGNSITIAHPDESPVTRNRHYWRLGETPSPRSRTCIEDAARYSISHAPQLACGEVLFALPDQQFFCVFPETNMPAKVSSLSGSCSLLGRNSTDKKLYCSRFALLLAYHDTLYGRGRTFNFLDSFTHYRHYSTKRYASFIKRKTHEPYLSGLGMQWILL